MVRQADAVAAAAPPKEGMLMNLPRIIIDAVLFCPHCGTNHVDEERNGEKWHRRAHTTHRCQSCRGDFDVYVSGQAALAAPSKVEPKPDISTSKKETARIIKEALERAGVYGVTVTDGSDLEFPLATLGSELRKMRIKVSEVVE